MDPLTINVTQADIDGATRMCPNNCVFAKAVLREHSTINSVAVYEDRLSIATRTGKVISYTMTEEAGAFAKLFDEGEKVESRSFTLPYSEG